MTGEIIAGLSTCLVTCILFIVKDSFVRKRQPGSSVCEQHSEISTYVTETRTLIKEMKEDIKEIKDNFREVFGRLYSLEQKAM